MSVNREKPHVFVLPEDDANRQLATGFLLAVDWNRQRQMRVLEPAGGWKHVLDLFKSDHVPEMDRYPERRMVLLIDFDNNEGRLQNAKDAIPEHLVDRVFVLGALSEPEALKAALGFSCETIGSKMAKDCREGTDTTWRHDLLRHNANELDRLRERVGPILFEPI